MIIAELIAMLATLDPEHQVVICGDETFTIIEANRHNTVIIDNTGIELQDGYTVLHRDTDEGYATPV